MNTRTIAEQIAFRYRATDTDTGVTRDTVMRLAAHLGVDETDAIHMALQALAAKLLPPYEADDGPLSDEQMRQIRELVPQGDNGSVRSSLVDIDLL